MLQVFRVRGCDHKLCRQFGVDAVASFAENRQVVGEFGGTAAGKHGDDMTPSDEIVFFTKLAAIFR